MAGKAKRSAAAEKRKKELANQKAAKKALYQSYALKGSNSKRKMLKARKGTRLVSIKDPNNYQALEFKKNFPPVSREERREQEVRRSNGLILTKKGELQLADRPEFWQEMESKMKVPEKVAA
jgi:predicted nuclease of restriction endonuclease-like (RecB) superfamily